MREYKDVRDIMRDFLMFDPRPLRGFTEQIAWVNVPGDKRIAHVDVNTDIILAVTSTEMTFIVAPPGQVNQAWREITFTRTREFSTRPGEKR